MDGGGGIDDLKHSVTPGGEGMAQVVQWPQPQQGKGAAEVALEEGALVVALLLLHPTDVKRAPQRQTFLPSGGTSPPIGISTTEPCSDRRRPVSLPQPFTSWRRGPTPPAGTPTAMK